MKTSEQCIAHWLERKQFSKSQLKKIKKGRYSNHFDEWTYSVEGWNGFEAIYSEEDIMPINS